MHMQAFTALVLYRYCSDAHKNYAEVNRVAEDQTEHISKQTYLAVGVFEEILSTLSTDV